MSTPMGSGLAGMLSVMGGVASGANQAGQHLPATHWQAIAQQVGQVNAALSGRANAKPTSDALTADQMEAIAASLQVIEDAINTGHVVHVSDRDGELFEALRMTLALAGVKLDPAKNPSYLHHCRDVVRWDERRRQEEERQKQERLGSAA